MTERKKWRIIYPGHPEVDVLPSKRQIYEFVDQLRSSWAAGGPTGSLTVQVNEGRGAGWQPYELVNFAEEVR